MQHPQRGGCYASREWGAIHLVRYRTPTRWAPPDIAPRGGTGLPTKRIFDLIVITGLALHLAWGGLVKPFGRRWASQKQGVASVVGEALVRAN